MRGAESSFMAPGTGPPPARGSGAANTQIPREPCHRRRRELITRHHQDTLSASGEPRGRHARPPLDPEPSPRRPSMSPPSFVSSRHAILSQRENEKHFFSFFSSSKLKICCLSFFFSHSCFDDEIKVRICDDRVINRCNTVISFVYFFNLSYGHYIKHVHFASPMPLSYHLTSINILVHNVRKHPKTKNCHKKIAPNHFQVL